MQLFSFYAFKSSKFAYIALSYICMLSNLCKKKKKKNGMTSRSHLFQFVPLLVNKIMAL